MTMGNSDDEKGEICLTENMDATNVSNMMPVYGHLPEDKEKILAMLKQGADEQGEERLRMRRDSMRSL